MRDLILIAIVLTCSLVALRRPVFGLLTFVWLGFFNPQTMMWGIGRTFRHSLIVSLTLIVGYLFWSEPKRIPRQRESILLLAMWVLFGFTTFLAFRPDLAMDRFVYVSKILLMMFLATSLINTDERLHLFLRVIALSLGFYALKGGIFSILKGGNYIVWGPEDTFLWTNNSIGLALDMNIPILLYLLKVETNKWIRRIMKVMLVLSYPAIIFTFSRGAWLGLAFVTAVMILSSKKKFMVAAAGGLAGIVLLPLLIQFAPQRLVDRYDAFVNYKEEASAQSRFLAWELCGRVGLRHPFNGGGFDFYSDDIYADYIPESMDEWYAEWGVSARAWSCHSIWLTILGEHGVIGLILWLGLLGSCFLSLRGLRAYGRAHPERAWVGDCAGAIQTSLGAFLIVGTFLDAAYFDMFYYLVAVIIIVKEKIILHGSPHTVENDAGDKHGQAGPLLVSKGY